MQISLAMLSFLNNNISDFPPETGGILGSDSNDVITDIILDIKSNTGHCCSYSPNVDFLNSCIAEWAERNIQFVGIFHTHFAGVQTLSEADKKYIVSIMQAMPGGIDKLYFPIYVLPDRELICYVAERKLKENFEICQDVLQIV